MVCPFYAPYPLNDIQIWVRNGFSNPGAWNSDLEPRLLAKIRRLTLSYILLSYWLDWKSGLKWCLCRASNSLIRHHFSCYNWTTQLIWKKYDYSKNSNKRVLSRLVRWIKFPIDLECFCQQCFTICNDVFIEWYYQHKALTVFHENQSNWEFLQSIYRLR